MKLTRSYISVLVVSLLLLAPLAFAANDVSYNAQFSVGGYTLTTGGTAYNADSITVNADNMTVTLSPSSVFYVSSADRRSFSVNNGQYAVITYGCTSSESSAKIATNFDSGSITFTITPSTTSTCSGSGGGGGGSGGGGGGGGGGGSSVPSTPLVVPAQQVAQPSAVARLVSPVFNSNLIRGSKGDDVRRLQELLKGDKDIYPEGDVTGFFGPATQRAIGRFQLKFGVVKNDKEVGFGRLGPMTRKKMQEVYSKEQPVAQAQQASAQQAEQAAKQAFEKVQKENQLKSLQQQLMMLLQKMAATLKKQ